MMPFWPIWPILAHIYHNFVGILHRWGFWVKSRRCVLLFAADNTTLFSTADRVLFSTEHWLVFFGWCCRER